MRQSVPFVRLGGRPGVVWVDPAVPGVHPVHIARAIELEVTTMIRRAAALTMAALLALGGAACGDDEDGDGGTTDEEIQEGEDTVDSLDDEIQEEVDAQDEGTNEDGE